MLGRADCNNFFVSCERVFNPSLNGKPVVVLSNNDGCVIARSNESKALGIPMGCPAFQIQDYCDPRQVVQLSARHVMYCDMSHRVMHILGEELEQLQVYSVDEAFFTLPYDDVERNHAHMARVVRRIYSSTGLPVSVGFAPSRTLAKIASHVAKKDRRITDGVYWLVRPEAIAIILRRTPVGDVWGIGRRLEGSLQARGITTALQLAQLSPAQVRRDYNVVVERTVRELRGENVMAINPVDVAHSSIMQSRTFGQIITSRREVQDAVVHFAQRCAKRLRDQNSVAGAVLTWVRGDRFREDLPFYSNSCQMRLGTPSSNAMAIVHHALLALNNVWRDGMAYRKAGVLVSDITPAHGVQLNLFEGGDPVGERNLMTAIDDVNRQYGRDMVQLAPELGVGQWRPKTSHSAPNTSTTHIYTGFKP
jgi:DNA polymerase V